MMMMMMMLMSEWMYTIHVYVCVCVSVCLSVCVPMCLCIAALISLLGVIIFARFFYGDVDVSPFGWSFGLTIVGSLFFFFNGIMLIVHTIFIHRYICMIGRSRGRSGGFMGCFTDCLGL